MPKSATLSNMQCDIFMTIKIKVTDRTSEKEFFTKMFENVTHCAHLYIMMHSDLTKV